MSFSAQHVCDHFPQLVLSCTDNKVKFSQISAIDDYGHTSLVFADTAEQLEKLLTTRLPSVVVTRPELASLIESNKTCVITVQNVRVAQALIKQKYADYANFDKEWPDIHPSAVIHPSSKLGSNVRIGPNSIIGESVVIGDNTSIRANCVIEREVKIGQFCTIHSLVNIGFACTVGDRVIIRPGVIIGNEGFGFAKDEQSRYHRIPHTGTVEIHDDVQIGTNCNIDRGTYGATVLSRGVKLDSLCHIAHNVKIGEDTLLVSQSGIAGSSIVGKRVVMSGQTGVLDHKSIVDDAVLLHRCGVTEDIDSPGMWAGTPPKPFKEYVSNLNSFQKLKRLEQKIDKKLERLEKLLKES